MTIEKNYSSVLAPKKGVEVEIFRPVTVIFKSECFDQLSEKNLQAVLFSFLCSSL